jgi:hypothetical protein
MNFGGVFAGGVADSLLASQQMALKQQELEKQTAMMATQASLMNTRNQYLQMQIQGTGLGGYSSPPPVFGAGSGVSTTDPGSSAVSPATVSPASTSTSDAGGGLPYDPDDPTADPLDGFSDASPSTPLDDYADGGSGDDSTQTADNGDDSSDQTAKDAQVALKYESGGNPSATAPDGSTGPVQITPTNWGSFQKFAKNNYDLDVPSSPNDPSLAQVAQDPNYTKAQLDWTNQNNVQPVMAYVEKNYPQVDTTNQGVRSLIFSLGNQNGPAGAQKVIDNALSSVDDDTPLSPNDFVNAVMDERGAKNADGSLKYFPSSPQLADSLSNRFSQERGDLLAMANSSDTDGSGAGLAENSTGIASDQPGVGGTTGGAQAKGPGAAQALMVPNVKDLQGYEAQVQQWKQGEQQRIQASPGLPAQKNAALAKLNADARSLVSDAYRAAQMRAQAAKQADTEQHRTTMDNRADTRANIQTNLETQKAITTSPLLGYVTDAQGRVYEKHTLGAVPAPQMSQQDADAQNALLKQSQDTKTAEDNAKISEAQNKFTLSQLQPVAAAVAAQYGLKYNPQEKLADMPSGFVIPDPNAPSTSTEAKNNIAAASAVMNTVEQLNKRGIYVDARDAGDVAATVGAQFDTLPKPQAPQKDAKGNVIGQAPGAIQNPGAFYQKNKDQLLGGSIYQYILGKGGTSAQAINAMTPQEVASYGPAAVAAQQLKAASAGTPGSVNATNDAPRAPVTSGVPNLNAQTTNPAEGLGAPIDNPQPVVPKPASGPATIPNDANLAGENVTPGVVAMSPDQGTSGGRALVSGINSAARGIHGLLAAQVPTVDTQPPAQLKGNNVSVPNDIAMTAEPYGNAALAAQQRQQAPTPTSTQATQQAQAMQELMTRYSSASPKDRAAMDALFARRSGGIPLSQVISTYNQSRNQH